MDHVVLLDAGWQVGPLREDDVHPSCCMLLAAVVLYSVLNIGKTYL